MFGILITALGNEGEMIDQILDKLKLRGYITQDISIITKLKNYKSDKHYKKYSDLAIPLKTTELTNLLSKAQIFPNLGEILISGPIAPAINFISSTETKPESSLFTLLLSIGIPKEDAFYFTEVVENNGFILMLPEFGDMSVYEILWNGGADRIIVLEENSSAQFGTL